MTSTRVELSPALATGALAVSYDRSTLTAGIVHIGVGHFHRAHQAMYLHRLLERGDASGWAIWGVSMGGRSSDALAAIRSQDCLYTLTEKAPDGIKGTTTIGSIIGIQSVDAEGQSIVARIADPATRIISLTITEGGYGIDPATGSFTGGGDERIAVDLADPTSMTSWLGLIVIALRRRRETGGGPVTIMSCDNIPHNGVVTSRSVTAFARRVAPDLVDWIEDNVTFPSSMVDRVTPATTDADRDYLVTTFGVGDAWAVTCEPFTQWALEDRFAAGRPAFEDAGVDLVDDVEPYERMKLRLANGIHQASSFFGTLLGHTFVHEAIADPDIQALAIRYIDEEAVPTLEPITGIDLNGWGRTVLERFGNPQIADPLTRICAETSDRVPKFVLPVAVDLLAVGRRAEICAAVVASWARYARGVGEKGETFDVRDPRKTTVMEAAQREVEHPGSFLALADIFGDLGRDPSFTRDFHAALDTLNRIGVRAFLSQLRLSASEGEHRVSSSAPADPRVLADRILRLGRPGVRTIVGLAGPPGTGKSTLVRRLVAALPGHAAVVPMDGFHLSNAVLDARNLRDRKGAIDTFDAAGFAVLMQRIRDRDEDVVYAPDFDHGTGEPIAASIPIPRDCDIVLVEGNYLGVAADPWSKARAVMDELWYLETPRELRVSRLIDRHVATGKTVEAATRWTLGSDERNAILVSETARNADLIVTTVP